MGSRVMESGWSDEAAIDRVPRARLHSFVTMVNGASASAT